MSLLPTTLQNSLTPFVSAIFSSLRNPQEILKHSKMSEKFKLMKFIAGLSVEEIAKLLPPDVLRDLEEKRDSIRASTDNSGSYSEIATEDENPRTKRALNGFIAFRSKYHLVMLP
jgi:hypothetical protein